VAAGVQAGPATGGDVVSVAEGLWAGRRCSAWSGDGGAWPAAPGLVHGPGAGSRCPPVCGRRPRR